MTGRRAADHEMSVLPEAPGPRIADPDQDDGPAGETFAHVPTEYTMYTNADRRHPSGTTGADPVSLGSRRSDGGGKRARFRSSPEVAGCTTVYIAYTKA